MNLTAVFIIGFIVLGIYKLFELFVRKSERMALIEKLTFSGENKEIHLPSIYFGKRDFGSWPLRFALLFMGIGLGCIIAFYMQYYYFNSFMNVNLDNWSVRDAVHQTQFVLYFSFITLFGGLGLFIAYIIESKKSKKEESDF
ncbi:hypothetical protein AGMMS50262_08230 [Bacteroidia bacterium]|nr:hypothetical protein AGMMS50262_08230 [Bacteroidia bacterium]